MEPVLDPVQDLTFSQGFGPIRDDCERARQILGRGPDELTQSEVVFVEVYLRNFDHVKSRIEALIEAYLDEAPMVAELLALSDRMDATLKRFLELQERASAQQTGQVLAQAADQALRDEELAHQDDSSSEQRHKSGEQQQQQQQEEEEEFWPDFAPFSCPICFAEVDAPDAALRLARCGHAMCRECAAELVTVAVDSAKVLDIVCPAPACKTEFSYSQIRSLLDPVSCVLCSVLSR